MEVTTQIRKRVTWTETMKHMMNLTHRKSAEKAKIINYFTFIAECRNLKMINLHS